jgi:hypothetical protein
LVAAKPDLLILQEVRCSTSELAELARQEACQVVFGEEVEGGVLVAAFAWAGSLQKISRCPTGQSHHFTWQMGSQKLQVRNGYFQGAVAQDRQFAEAELASWLEQAELSGEPTLVAGDFNAVQSELEASCWYEAAGWFELGGPQQPATCLPSKGQPRRLDWLLASRGLQPALRGQATVRWDLGLKPHAVQEFWVELQEKRRYSKWVPATPLAPLEQAPSRKPHAGRQGSGPAAEAASESWQYRAVAYWCSLIWKSRQHQWQEAIASGSVEAAWETFWQSTIELHNHGSGGLQEEWLPGYAKMQSELKPQKAGQTSDRVTSLLVQRVGQLEALHKVCNVAGAEQAMIRKQLVRKLRTDRGCQQVPPIAGNLADPLAIKSWLKQSKAALEHHRVQAADQRRDAWHSWLERQKASGSKAIYAWLRQDDTTWLPSGCGKQQQLEEADEAWWGLWGAKLDRESVDAAVAKVPAGEAMPRQKPVSGRHLRKVALAMGRRAGGADGLQAADWQAWPMEHWDKLAELLELCERQGR